MKKQWFPWFLEAGLFEPCASYLSEIKGFLKFCALECPHPYQKIRVSLDFGCFVVCNLPIIPIKTQRFPKILHSSIHVHPAHPHQKIRASSDLAVSFPWRMPMRLVNTWRHYMLFFRVPRILPKLEHQLFMHMEGATWSPTAMCKDHLMFYFFRLITGGLPLRLEIMFCAC